MNTTVIYKTCCLGKVAAASEKLVYFDKVLQTLILYIFLINYIIWQIIR